MTFGGAAIEDVFEEVITNFGITPSMFSYILTTSSLLCGLFSGIATMGMEAANFRDHWDNPIFQVCGGSMLRTKMGIYSVITGLASVTIVVICTLLQTDILPFTFSHVLELWTLGGPNDVFSGLIEPLQQEYNCCGINFVNQTEAENLPAGYPPTCGSYVGGVPIGCECYPTNSTNCESGETANDVYGCDIKPDEFIYTEGCLDVFTEKYLSEFGSLWIIFYGIAAALFVGFLLSIFICCEPGTGQIEDSGEEEDEIDEIKYKNKYLDLREKYQLLVKNAQQYQAQMNQGMVNPGYHS